MHIHQQNHWNRVLFHWYQSYHWYQWRPFLSPLRPVESICEYWTTRMFQLIRNYLEWIIKQLINSAFVRYMTIIHRSGGRQWWILAWSCQSIKIGIDLSIDKSIKVGKSDLNDIDCIDHRQKSMTHSFCLPIYLDFTDFIDLYRKTHLLVAQEGPVRPLF